MKACVNFIYFLEFALVKWRIDCSLPRNGPKMWTMDRIRQTWNRLLYRMSCVKSMMGSSFFLRIVVLLIQGEFLFLLFTNKLCLVWGWYFCSGAIIILLTLYFKHNTQRKKSSISLCSFT